MESKKVVLGIALIALGFASCKDEKETQAEKTVDTYVVYVDSLGNIPAQDAKLNWQAIDASYEMRSMEADAALTDLKDAAKAQERINASRAKYEALKAKLEAEAEADKLAAAASNPKQKLRNKIFVNKPIFILRFILFSIL